MKALWSLLLIASPLAARADVAPALAQSAQLIASLQTNLQFLNARVDDCTSYGSTIQSMMVQPIEKDVADAKARLAKFEATGPNACTSRDDLVKIIAAINGRLVMASTPSFQLMNYTPDQALTKALSGDDSHPRCAPHNPNDATSTDQFRAYTAVKAKLNQLKSVATTLKAGVDCSR